MADVDAVNDMGRVHVHGVEVSGQLDITPEQARVIQHERIKYALIIGVVSMTEVAPFPANRVVCVTGGLSATSAARLKEAGCLRRVGNGLLRGGLPSVLHVQTVYLVVCASRALPLPAMAFYEPNDESGRPYAGASVLPAATVRRCRRPPERAHGVFKKAA
ncbi:MAG: hypothetical protein ACN6OP_27560 [Pseudomonadales bacterium]